MGRETGIEPATSRATILRSNQLSYSRRMRLLLQFQGRNSQEESLKFFYFSFMMKTPSQLGGGGDFL